MQCSSTRSNKSAQGLPESFRNRETFQTLIPTRTQSSPAALYPGESLRPHMHTIARTISAEDRRVQVPDYFPSFDSRPRRHVRSMHGSSIQCPDVLTPEKNGFLALQQGMLQARSQSPTDELGSPSSSVDEDFQIAQSTVISRQSSSNSKVQQTTGFAAHRAKQHGQETPRPPSLHLTSSSSSSELNTFSYLELSLKKAYTRNPSSNQVLPTVATAPSGSKLAEQCQVEALFAHPASAPPFIQPPLSPKLCPSQQEANLTPSPLELPSTSSSDISSQGQLGTKRSLSLKKSIAELCKPIESPVPPSLIDSPLRTSSSSPFSRHTTPISTPDSLFDNKKMIPPSLTFQSRMERVGTPVSVYRNPGLEYVSQASSKPERRQSEDVLGVEGIHGEEPIASLRKESRSGGIVQDGIAKTESLTTEASE